jgi:osmoprotectant transport system permease protein
MRDELSLLPGLLTAHLALTLFPLLLGVSLSIPLGVACSRSRLLERVALDAAAIVQTVPSLALLALMVPVLGALGLTTIGFLPAFLALVLYSVLPVLRNTVAALSGLSPALLEAARGVGMSPREQLFRVELPLALPVIVAGVRTAVVWTVGAATLATPVGADSLGYYIFTGLQTRNSGAVLLGCLASAGLALVLDGLTRLLLVGIERSRRRLVVLAGGAFLALYLYAGTAAAIAWAEKSSDPVRIGTKTFTEQYILGEIVAQRVQRAAGLTTETTHSLGSSVAFDALVQGEIDAYVDYSGTIWATIMKRSDPVTDRSRILREVTSYLKDRHGVVVVGALGFENTYALAMPRSRAEQLGVRRISDLAAVSSALTLGADYEFMGRPEWKHLRSVYGLAFRAQLSMDASLMYQAVAEGAVDVLSAFSTDGRIEAFDLVVLEDDRRAIPPYDAIVLASKSLSMRHPAAIAALRGLTGRIGAARMRQMNLAVDVEGRSPAAVAEDFLAAPRSLAPDGGAR